ncbi:MAG: DUF4358 domain-containing protein [Parasporobacterium sp.]|nr:DUF4358 domain-containing protein [Parasporobacterium sp.]
MVNRAFVLRIISFLMVAGLVIVIIVSMSGSRGSRKSIDEVSPVLIQLFENDRTELSPERMFKKHYGFNAADFDGVVLYSPKSNMDAEELLIVKLADENQGEALLAAAEQRRADQMNIYEGYAPEQYDLCKNGIADLQGNYFLYVVHENAAEIDSSFRKALD